MPRLATIAALLLGTVVIPSIEARNLEVPSYDKLFAKSDFVVIARPVTATRDTREHSAMRDLGDPPIPVIGVETDFESLLVIKGRRRQRFTLHHYRWAPPDEKVVMVNGPRFVSYDSKPSQPTLLMFLVRERDGRFAPAAGQADPESISIETVSGMQ